MSQSLDNGFAWTRCNKTSRYLSLHETTGLSGVKPKFVLQKYPVAIPYDAFDPAGKENLKNWKCSISGMYFGTIKMMSMHRQSCKQVDDNAESNNTLVKE